MKTRAAKAYAIKRKFPSTGILETLHAHVQCQGRWLAGLSHGRPLMMVAMRQKLLNVPMKYLVARSRRHVSRSGTTGRQRPHGHKVRCRRIFH